MADFGRAILTDTHLQGADLTMAGSFIQAKLQDTELFGAILEGTNFEQATIIDLKRPMHWKLEDLRHSRSDKQYQRHAAQHV